MNYNFDKTNQNKYDDILLTQWPQPSTREPMSLNQRAKIFLPFAALKGFEEEIARHQNAAVEREENPPKSPDREFFDD